MCALNFFTKFCLKCFSFWEQLNDKLPQMYLGIYVKDPLFFSDFNETWIFFQKIFKKISWKYVH